MKYSTDNSFMNSAFGTMNKILKTVERSLDDDVFNLERFNAKEFNISHNRFARILKMLSDDNYISGIKVEDRGEPNEFDKADYQRFKILIGEVSITIKGLQFLAENTMLAKSYNIVKGLREIAPV